MKGVHDSQYGKYETASIIKKDEEMVDQLRFLAQYHNMPIVDEIADRLFALTEKAHQRLHWTGKE
tara:strand:+ start:1373 stop:1567 length:195 start_codon:yes stop_codon:yes gene_type:complete